MQTGSVRRSVRLGHGGRPGSCGGVLWLLLGLLWGTVVGSARAQDSTYRRPPLGWELIERSISRWADARREDAATVDPAWQRAWPAIEEAYLQFLEGEHRRRTIDGRAVADAYEPIASGVATPEEIDRYRAIWSSHLDRCDAAEDSFLRSLRELLPASAQDVADALLRERAIERSSERHWGVGPGMHRIVGTMLDARLEPSVRAIVRDRVRSAQEAMIPHVRVLSEALAARELALDRGRAREAWLPAGNSDAAPASETSGELAGERANDRRAERLEAIRAATAAAAARPTELAGKAFAAIERIGAEAVLAVVGVPGSPLDEEQWRRVVDALGAPEFGYAVGATLDVYRWRLDVITARFPPSDAARVIIAEATERFDDEARRAFVEAFRSLAEDGLLGEQHLLDLAADRPSSWAASRELRAARQSERFMIAFNAWADAVREALGVPAESHWPRHERDADGIPIPEERPPDHLAEFERMELSLGFQWTPLEGDRQSVLHGFPAWRTIEAMAMRLRLPSEVVTRWQAAHASTSAAWSESVDREDAAIIASLYDGQSDERTDEAMAVQQSRAIAAQARALRASLAAALREAVRDPSVASSLTDEDRALAEVEILAWERQHRIPDGRTASRPSRGLAILLGAAAASASADPAPIAWSTNPFEALDRLDLPLEVRGAVTRSVSDEAERLIRASEAVDDVTLLIADQHCFRDILPMWNAQSPAAERRLALDRALVHRDAMLAGVLPAARARAAAAAALVEAMTHALPEAWRDDFQRANREVAHPGIDTERPRFERPLLAALRQTASDPDRAARMVEIHDRWDRQWTARAEEIARIGEGTAFALAVTGGWGQLPSAHALHAVSVVRWIEFRRRQESLVTMRAMMRVLRDDERVAIPRW